MSELRFETWTLPAADLSPDNPLQLIVQVQTGPNVTDDE